jgi:squalene-hopene/tetraprenyl-beta-curcumene cyclase
MKVLTWARRVLTVICICSIGQGAVLAAAAPSEEELLEVIAPAQAWLLAQQDPEGSYAGGSVGVTALITDALLGGLGGVPVDDPRVAKSIAWLVTHQQPSGAIFDPNEGVANYATALSLMAFAKAGGVDQTVIDRAVAFLKSNQNLDENDINYGGIGYGSAGKGQEDLSNTGFAIEALRASGVPPEDEALQRAMKFLQRCQNLSSVNDLPWAADDGGAVYAPHESKAQGSFHEGDPPIGKVELRSYGSMTYALIKSYLYLNLSADDPRLAAALGWIRQNYQFEANPGLPAGREQEGLFYYYLVMAKSFKLLGQPTITIDGQPRDWRADLFAEVKKRAQAVPMDDGTKGLIWINSARRWRENFPHVVNSYIITALKNMAAQ